MIIKDLNQAEQKYNVIYADPPWAYRNKNTGGSMKSGASAKYKTMELNEIINLPVRDIASKNVCLFLWSTTPFLPSAFLVMQEWGFTYKTAIYWRKTSHLGMGFWFRGEIEVCLFGIQGKVKAFRCSRPNFIQTKSLRHSQKPIELYTIIEEVTEPPRIELFARDIRSGWDCWGNEISEG